MLVLSRKHNETLHIGNDIVITIVRVRGDSVRIGIEAPKEIHVMRSELLGTPAKQPAAPESRSSQPPASKLALGQPSLGQPTAPEQTDNKGEHEASSAAAGPLAKFFKVCPKVELATAS